MPIFNEDTRVKFPATAHFLRLGYKYININKQEIDFETKIFRNLFKESLTKINNFNYADEEIRLILDKINSCIKNDDLGQSFYNWLINPLDKVRLIDFDNINNNNFYIVNELPFSPKENTQKGSFRPDINILINGIPLSFLEVKKPNNEGGIKAEFNRMIDQRLENSDFKKYFNMLQIVSFSNNMEYVDYENDESESEDVNQGSFYTTPNGPGTSFSFFREDNYNYFKEYEYLDLSNEQVKQIVRDGGYNPNEVDSQEFQDNLSVFKPCNKFITSLYDKERLMYILKYGIMYLIENTKIEDKTTNQILELPIPQRHIMRYPQFFATRKIIERLEGGGKGGIIWHTQGSGKTELSAFSNKILRDYYAKKGISAKFYFIVDRLDLMTQASTEFKNCNFNVINCKDRKELADELNKPLTITNSNCIGDMCVVNIHKLMDKSKMPQAKNEYGVKVQRIFFVDEAHRSYSKSTGEFYKNLMTCDDDGVYIALTGTPLLSKKVRSNLRFGDYIHKYFYDKSIADGYTLKIKKESINTIAKAEILENLDLQDADLDSPEVFESKDYVKAVGEFIERDFKHFRFTNSDKTIGGMIVCRTNPQAIFVHDWFQENSKLKTGLVLSNTDNPTQNQINKTNQINFRENGHPDILVVNLMLTTGYDVKRLKKMYLLRGPKAQSLLQTISRVNRPYKSPDGKTYKYGYIVDFVDIEEEFNKTLDAYIKELESELTIDGENEGSLNGLIVDKETIKEKFEQLKVEASKLIPEDNLESFNDQLSLYNKETLYKIRRILNNIKDCKKEFELSRALDYSELIDLERLNKFISITQNRIDFLNLKDDTLNSLEILNNEEVVNVIYEFIKTKIEILDLGNICIEDIDTDLLKTLVSNLQEEIKNNKNRKDPKVADLEELIKKMFNKNNITNLDEIYGELEEAYNLAKTINEENEKLAEKYGGNYGFVKTYMDGVVNTSLDKSDLENFLLVIYNQVKDSLDKDILLLQGRKVFVDITKKATTPILVKSNIYSKLKGFIDEVLNDLYSNIQIYK